VSTIRILIIEDEADIVEFLELELQHEGYETQAALDGRSGLSLALHESFDLILLDVMMPQINGIEVLRRIRREKEVPIILLTARGTVVDKVTGLDMGANDYVTKPFYIEELLARIRLVFRIHGHAKDTGDILVINDLSLDTIQRRAERAGEQIDLTKTQFDLLEYLMRNCNIVLTREQILNEVWGYNYLGDTNVVDVYISYIRAKIHDTDENRLIETVRGIGYVIRSKE